AILALRSLHREPAMAQLATAWESLRTQVLEHRMQLGFSLRVTVAAVVSFAVSLLLHVPLPLWTVLTAVILTQVNFGRSLKATLDYLAGTLGGAVYSGAVAALVPHPNEIALAGSLALAVAPLALLGAIKPSFSAGTFTGVLVLLVPGIAHVGPIESAVYRVIEVAVGGITALAVSLVLPARARRSYADSGGTQPARVVCGPHAKMRCGGDRAHPGQHRQGFCAARRHRGRGEARADRLSRRRARSRALAAHAAAAAPRSGDD